MAGDGIGAELERQKQTALLAYGPCHVTISRRVSDEEVVSVEWYGRSYEIVKPEVNASLADLRAHMMAHNKEVVLANQAHLAEIDRQIEQKSQQLRDLRTQVEGAEADLAQRRKKLSRVG